MLLLDFEYVCLKPVSDSTSDSAKKGQLFLVRSYEDSCLFWVVGVDDDDDDDIFAMVVVLLQCGCCQVVLGIKAKTM